MAKAGQIIKPDDKPGGSTYFNNALQQVQVILAKNKTANKDLKTRILFLSDGEDMSTVKEVDNLLTLIEKEFSDSIASWWNVGFGPNAGEGRLLQMAQHFKIIKAEFKNAVTADKL